MFGIAIAIRQAMQAKTSKDEWKEAYEERVAIMEHDGNICKREAEVQARKDIDRRRRLHEQSGEDDCDSLSYYERVGEIAAHKFDAMAQNKQA